MKMHWICLLLACSWSWAEQSWSKPPKALYTANSGSLQRGAKYFMHYCSGCHSLKYLRFNELAQGIQAVDSQGHLYKDMLSNALLMYGKRQWTDVVETHLDPQSAQKWFGVVPPDLSLIVRAKGMPYLWAYLRGFYLDTSRPTGTNNHAYPQTAMPHVLESLQGLYSAQGTQLHAGVLSPAEFDQWIIDLLHFLDYVSEPHKMQRQRLGGWVVLFLAFMSFLTYLLKREYWKDIEHP